MTYSTLVALAASIAALLTVASPLQAQVPADFDEASPPPPLEAPYLRAAVDLGVGYIAIPEEADEGYALRLQGRVGVQIIPIFAVVYQGGLALVGLTNSGEEINSWQGAGLENAVLATFTLADLVDLAVGPATDVYLWDTPYATGLYSVPFVAPGGRMRVAAHIPFHSNRRAAFTIGADASATVVSYNSEQSDLTRTYGLYQAGASTGVEWY